MNLITSIQQLAETLDEIDPQKHASTMRRVSIAPRDLTQYNTWCKEGYTRNCLARTEAYELILLCWEVGAKTPIHGHGGENCWVYQIQGTVEEVRYEENNCDLKEVQRCILTPGKLTYMNDQMGYHSIENNSNQRAMTLHVYASPIDSCKVYNNQKDCFELTEMSYHSYKGKEVENLVY